MFFLRLNRLHISDNHTRKSFLGLLGPDRANIKIASFISTDQSVLPDLDRFVDSATRDTERTEILAAAIEDTLSRRVFTTFPNVEDGHVLTFGDAGYTVHQDAFIPQQLDWSLLVVKSNREGRKLGMRVDELLGDEKFPAFQRNLVTVLMGAAGAINPGFLAAAGIARFIGEAAAEILKRKDDELIGLYYNSLNRLEHYPHGERKRDNSPGVTGNISLDYSLFGTPTVVRKAIPVHPLPGETVSEPISPIGPAISVRMPPPSESPTPEEIPPEAAPLRLRDREQAGLLAGEPYYRFRGEKPIFWTAEMTIDADGSPRAYHPQSSKGLDALGNAGTSGNWWGVATHNGKTSGKPVVQRDGDPAPGFYVSTTALADGRKESTDPARYVDSEWIPYVVLPGRHETDARLGDLAVIVNLRNRKHTGTIFADIGPSDHLGEASMAAAEAVGIDSSPRRGGQSGDVFYLVFPGSGNGKPIPKSRIAEESARLFEDWGGLAAVEQAVNASLSVPAEPMSSVHVESGSLEQIVADKKSLSLDDVRDSAELAREIQTILGAQGFIDPPADGKWGRISNCGWEAFCKFADLGDPAPLAEKHARKLLDIKGKELIPIQTGTGDPLAERVCLFMLANRMWIARAEGMINIVYLEAVDPSGEINEDIPNQFNDLRMIIAIEKGGKPAILGKWEATTEPGTYYTKVKLLNPLGAARIAFGQYRAWTVGMHRGNHEALRQSRDITIYRDADKNYLRRGDVTQTGQFFINQHWGYDRRREDIGTASAGCLVGRTRSGHREFMALVKSDIRYKANRRYTFYTTVLDGRVVLRDA